MAPRACKLTSISFTSVTARVSRPTMALGPTRPRLSSLSCPPIRLSACTALLPTLITSFRRYVRLLITVSGSQSLDHQPALYRLQAPRLEAPIPCLWGVRLLRGPPSRPVPWQQAGALMARSAGAWADGNRCRLVPHGPPSTAHWPTGSGVTARRWAGFGAGPGGGGGLRGRGEQRVVRGLQLLRLRRGLGARGVRHARRHRRSRAPLDSPPRVARREPQPQVRTHATPRVPPAHRAGRPVVTRRSARNARHPPVRTRAGSPSAQRDPHDPRIMARRDARRAGMLAQRGVTPASRA
jgi:hypothetical protein